MRRRSCNDCSRNAPPSAAVIYDNRLQVVAQALGTHNSAFRACRRQTQVEERDPSPLFSVTCLRPYASMIVVHRTECTEYPRARQGVQGCCHMEPAYTSPSLMRAWLYWQDSEVTSSPVTR